MLINQWVLEKTSGQLNYNLLFIKEYQHANLTVTILLENSPIRTVSQLRRHVQRIYWCAPVLREMEPEIKMDVAEDDKAYTVRAEIPGVKKDDIKVAVEGNQVSISAEVKKEKERKRARR